MKNKCTFLDIGLMDYEKVWKIQEEIHIKLIKNNPDSQEMNQNTNYIIFCEHPHVYTLGKSGKENNLLINDTFLKNINATYFKTNRGGDITYHGPGQIVGYPILNLDNLKIGVKKYIYLLEQSIIDTLKLYSIKGERLEGSTGVWLDVNDPARVRKICAIGVRLSRSVTMHGFALNVNTDLTYFNHINPCGFNDKGVTSIEKEMRVLVDMKRVKTDLLNTIKENFKLEIINSVL